MPAASTPPSGPRGAVGKAAEDAAAAYLIASGWSIVARNVRVDRDEIDLIGIEPGQPPTLAFVEVRSRSSARFGSARESVDHRKVARLYRAATAWTRAGYPGLEGMVTHSGWRVDLLTLTRAGDSDWQVDIHLRGLHPP